MESEEECKIKAIRIILNLTPAISFQHLYWLHENDFFLVVKVLVKKVHYVNGLRCVNYLKSD